MGGVEFVYLNFKGERVKKVIVGLFIGFILSIATYGGSWYNTTGTNMSDCIKGPNAPKEWTPLQLKKNGFTIKKIKKHLYLATLDDKMMVIAKTYKECKSFVNGLKEYRHNK